MIRRPASKVAICFVDLNSRSHLLHAVKRSEINSLIREAITLINEMNFRLPPLGYCSRIIGEIPAWGASRKSPKMKNPRTCFFNDYTTFL